MAAENYYEVLGLRKGANDEEVKHAFRELAKNLHPDRNPSDPEAERHFKLVSTAYEALKDEARRRAYDEWLAFARNHDLSRFAQWGRLAALVMLLLIGPSLALYWALVALDLAGSSGKDRTADIATTNSAPAAKPTALAPKPSAPVQAARPADETARQAAPESPATRTPEPSTPATPAPPAKTEAAAPPPSQPQAADEPVARERPRSTQKTDLLPSPPVAAKSGIAPSAETPVPGPSVSSPSVSGPSTPTPATPAPSASTPLPPGQSGGGSSTSGFSAAGSSASASLEGERRPLRELAGSDERQNDRNAPSRRTPTPPPDEAAQPRVEPENSEGSGAARSMARMLAEFKEPNAASQDRGPAERNQRQAAISPEERPRPPAASAPDGEDFTDCDRCPVMSVVVASDFAPGDPAAQRVRPVRTLAISRSEVTVAEWNACVRDGACFGLREGAGTGNRPVVDVSRSEAVAYAEWLSRRTGKFYRPMKSGGGWTRSGAEQDRGEGDDPRARSAYCSGPGSESDPDCTRQSYQPPRSRDYGRGPARDASGFRVARSVGPND